MRLARYFAVAAVLAATPPAAMAASPKVDTQVPSWFPASPRVPLHKLKIGITVLYPASNAYQAVYYKTDQKYCSELGIQCKIMDPQGDPQKQFQQIVTLSAEHLNALIVWPTSKVAEIPAIKKAYGTGVPIVISNSEIAKVGRKYTVGFTGPDDCFQAKTAAHELIQGLHAHGNIVMVLGTPGYTVSMVRERCFLQVLKQAPKIKILSKQPANWERQKAQSIMETYLTKYGTKINGVYAEDDGMGLGVINAIKEEHIPRGKIILTTANQFPLGYNAIRQGWEYGSVGQSPKLDARLAIKTAILVAEGQSVPSVQHFATPAITRRNIFYFKRPNWSGYTK